MNPKSAYDTLDALVPISRFNKGEASRIFDEVRESEVGYKVVVKNNAPAGVIFSPESYKALMEELDDMYLLALALEREKNDNGVTYAAQEVYEELGIPEDELDEIPMEYGVDFE